ncbi:hypothetical protein LP420_12380 [Massilia sp. B-10]|nr:hypothetical protein LP420_12380 [Massilia sp. B-10]
MFGTQLTTIALDKSLCYSSPCVYYPPDGAPWNPDPVLIQLIDDAYIQWPHIYLSDPSINARGPQVDYFHLDVLEDVPARLNVPPIHRERHHGEGIRVAMIDTGFDHAHPFFVRNGFTSSVVLAPSATNRATDPGSHGTGESANVFAIAPKVTFIGVKLGDDADPSGGASILEGFQEALKHKPHVITVSMCYDLRELDGKVELGELPNGLKPLEAEIQAAIAVEHRGRVRGRERPLRLPRVDAGSAGRRRRLRRPGRQHARVRLRLGLHQHHLFRPPRARRVRPGRPAAIWRLHHAAGAARRRDRHRQRRPRRHHAGRWLGRIQRHLGVGPADRRRVRCCCRKIPSSRQPRSRPCSPAPPSMYAKGRPTRPAIRKAWASRPGRASMARPAPDWSTRTRPGSRPSAAVCENGQY